MCRFTATAGIIALIAFAAEAGQAATFAVNSVADAGDSAPGDGSCASPAGVCTLRAAIAEANALPGPDSITLQTAKHLLDEGEISITGDVTIAGSGAQGCIVRGNNKARIFSIAANANVILSGLAIERGRAVFGGAILNDGELRLTDAVISRSTAADLELGRGGGIYNTGVLELTNVSLFRNRATGRSGGLGGSIYNDAAAILRNVEVSRSRATGCGGGVFNNAGSIELIDSTIEKNSASSSGGGLFHQAGSMTLTNAVVRRNRAPAIGGGIFTYGTLRLTNVSISRNRSSSGGGLFSRVTPITELTNVTISLNRAGEGAGIMNSGTVSMKNTIVAQNRPHNCEGLPVVSSGHNLAGDASCALTQGSDLSMTDPLLAPLRDDGSGTMTHALLVGSPAIDAGDDAACPATDQRGLARPTDGDGDTVATCDIGAYERQP